MIEAYYSEEQVHILKTNEVIKIGEVTFEVLYTPENLYPEISTFNDYSVILMMEVKGQKILWLGDIYKRGSEYLLEKQYDKLDCEIERILNHDVSSQLLQSTIIKEHIISGKGTAEL